MPETLNELTFWILCGVIVALQAVIALAGSIVAYFMVQKFKTLEENDKELFERANQIEKDFSHLCGQHELNHG